MKQLLLLIGLLAGFSANAAHESRRRNATLEHAKPAVDSGLLRTSCHTGYFREVLRLGRRQAAPWHKRR